MTQISKDAFNTLYADAAGTFADNTTRDISAGDMRQFAEDIKDSCLFKLNNVINKVTGTISTAQMLTLGSSPVTIISAPGANKYLNILNINISYKYGSVVYDFGASDHPTFRFDSSTDAAWIINYLYANGASDYNRILGITATDIYGSVPSITNDALIFTTGTNGDPTQGDGDIDVVVWYTIEDVNV